MKIKVIRDIFYDECTLGQMLIDGKPFCFTLEDKVRPPEEKKVYGKTAIPAGTYKVVMDYSAKYQRLMPHILDVPGFEGIRIHSGNIAQDTEGCILVGLKREGKQLTESRLAFASFRQLLTDALENGEKCEINIINQPTERGKNNDLTGCDQLV